jgi:hypothetical protein
MHWLLTLVLRNRCRSKKKILIWCKPTSGSYKLNIDASYQFRWFRFWRGCAPKSYMACTLENLLNAATGEALALLKGLEFMEQLVLLYVLSLIPSSWLKHAMKWLTYGSHTQQYWQNVSLKSALWERYLSIVSWMQIRWQNNSLRMLLF